MAVARHPEGAFNNTLLFGIVEGAGVGAVTEQQPDSTQYNRLTRPCFARYDIEFVVGRKFEFVNQRVIFYE